MSGEDTPYMAAFRHCVVVLALAHARRNGDTETVEWLEAKIAAGST